MYEQYMHFGKDVWVRSDLKGKHRAHCLCWNCDLFKPDTPTENCQIAQKLYQICVEENLVTPVFECPKFVEKHENSA